MPILDDDEFKKLKEILDLPETENNPDDVYNVKQWCKSLIVKLERRNTEINDKADRIHELQLRNADLVRDKQALEGMLNDKSV